MITIGREDVLQALPDVVADHGADHVYQRPPRNADGTARTSRQDGGWVGTCYYVHTAAMRGDTDTTRLDVGCFAGAVLNKLGVDLSEMARIELTHGATGVFTLAGQLHDSAVAQIDPAAMRVLEAAQQFSDTGNTWGQVSTFVLNQYSARPAE